MLNCEIKGPFYITVIDAPLTDVWYKSQVMEVNTINTILSRIKNKSSFAELYTNKKVTNHSARKTSGQNLESFRFPKCEIKNITGHNFERGLDAYDPGNENEFFAMSSVISKSTYSTLTVVQKKLSHRHHRDNIKLISPELFIQHP